MVVRRVEGIDPAGVCDPEAMTINASPIETAHATDAKSKLALIDE